MDGPQPNRPRPNLRSRKTFWQSFFTSAEDIFFPDGGIQRLRGQPPRKKAWTIFRYLFPIVDWLPKYDLTKLRHDALAGLTIASLAVPQGISYARLANLPPVYGLYPSLVPPIVYAALGSSNYLAVGPVAAASLLLGSIIGEAVSPSENPSLYLQLFFTAAFFTGVFQLALGFCRLGILVDFLSRSTIVGFMGGTATIIILQQLKGMLGLDHFTNKTDIISVMKSIFSQKDQWRWQSAMLGFGFLVILFSAQYLKERIRRFFWVSAISPMAVVIIGGVVAYTAHGEANGIPTIGPLRKGINPFSAGDLNFHHGYLKTTVKAGAMSGLLALAEGIAIGRTFAMKKNEKVDGNKEMVAFGMMNLVGSMTSCYLTTGAFSKSAVNANAGCKTAVSNVVMSACMLVVILFLAPLFQYTPLVALSAIIIAAMVRLVEYEKVVLLFKIDKFDFCACMAAFLGVVFRSMDAGLAISVGFSVLRLLLGVARPTPCKLGQITDPPGYCEVENYPDSRPIPGVLVVQPGSPVCFANCGYLKARVLRWVNEEKAQGELKYVLLDMGGVSYIDKTGLDMLDELRKTLLSMDRIKLAIVNPRIEVGEKMVVSGFHGKIKPRFFFLTVDDAVETCRFLIRCPPDPQDENESE